MVDGENVKNYTKEELCNKVGVVQQRAVLFKGSIRDNMRWGKEDATDAEIWEALTTARAKEVVEAQTGSARFYAGAERKEPLRRTETASFYCACAGKNRKS